MKKYFIPILAVSFLMACNNGSDKKSSDNTDTSMHMDMHAVTPVEMPPMPEVPAGAKVFFSNIKDGQTITSPFKVEMRVVGMSVDTANGIIKPASGHHHILIGMDSVAAETVIPKDSVHLHYGNAQTSAEITLPPGKHTLTLQFADAMHRSYGSKLTSKVTVNVKQ